MKKTYIQMSFSEPYVRKRTSKNTFFQSINKIIDWNAVESALGGYVKRGMSAVGKPSYPNVLLFKMLLVGIWNGLSDRDTEDMALENLSVMRFLGLRLEDDVPDHSVLSKFRTELGKNKGFDAVLQLLNNQLAAHHIVVKKGVKIDATITDSPRKPKGKPVYAIAMDRQEDTLSEEEKQSQEGSLALIKKQQPGLDTEGRWIKKAGRLRFGYKNHVITDENGLVLGLHTTAANEHDSKSLETLLDSCSLPEHTAVFADKAYKSKQHDDLLKERKLKNRIHRKAVRGKGLTTRELRYNKLLSKRRYTVERTFGSMVRWFGTGTARYVGLVRTHAQHVLESMAYNLKRCPRLLIENNTKPITCIG